MMILSILVGVALAQTEPAGYREPPSLYRAIAVVPTGKNGYEDYLKGIDRLRAGDVLRLIEATSGEPGETTYLEGRRLLAVRFKDALADIRRGNDKPVTNPRWEVLVDRTMPELRWVQPAVEVFRADAYVRMAGGEPVAGLKSLFDASTFVTNIQANGPLTSFAAGVNPQRRIMAEVADRLPHASLVELAEIERWATARLDAKSVVPSSLRIENIFIDETLKGLANNDFMYRRGLPGVMLEELDRMSPTDRLKVHASVSLALTDYVKRWNQTLTLPEGLWQPPDHAPYGEWGDRVVGTLEDNMVTTVDLYRTERTRLRLIVLTARVYEYLWEHDRLPAKPAEVAPREMLVDPLNGGSFGFNMTGDRTAQVFSNGPKGGDPIYLESNKPSADSEGKKGRSQPPKSN